MASGSADANASVPATTGSAGRGNSGGNSARGTSLGDGNDMLFGFNRLNLLRQIGLMVGLAASVALGLAVVLWAQEPNYQPVLGDMSGYNPGEVSQVLDSAGIQYHIEPHSGALLVAADDVYRARLQLASAGVTGQQMQGFELLDQDQGLGTSQFMEQARYRRSLEGELARTISSMSSVSGARVHLAIPKDSVFVRDSRKPSASVFLDVFAGRRLEEGQIAAIINLVAGSVPQLSRQDVTVVDQKGNLLSRPERDAVSQQITEQFDYNRRVEEKLNSRITNILSPIIGAGRFRAEVSADLDFSELERAEELYNPDQQTLRSEQISTERLVGSAGGGVPGALSNQPPTNAVAPEDAVAEGGEGPAPAPPVTSRENATRNYEIDRTVSYSRREAGQINRLSIAVAVDDLRQANAETGAIELVPWPAAELDRLTLLVRDAVGYSAARGDSVTVINTAFALEQEIHFEELSFWQEQWLRDLIKPALAFLAIVILVLVLVRPALKNLASGGRGRRDDLLGHDNDLDGLGGADDSAIKQALGQGDDLLLPGATHGYDKQLNALKGLIAEDPARVAQVMRQWVNADE